MSALGLSEHQPKTRISPRVREAVRFMVEDGLNRAAAAQKAGLTDHALYCALRTPHVCAYRNDVMRVLRESEAARTIARGAKLADTAESEHVRNDANKWLAGLEGISPVTKSESVNVHKHLTPGLTIVIGGWAAHGSDAQLIDQQPHQVREPHVINRIGSPVPHPSQRNAPVIDVVPAEIGPPGAGGEGEK